MRETIEQVICGEQVAISELPILLEQVEALVNNGEQQPFEKRTEFVEQCRAAGAAEVDRQTAVDLLVSMWTNSQPQSPEPQLVEISNSSEHFVNNSRLVTCYKPSVAAV